MHDHMTRASTNAVIYFYRVYGLFIASDICLDAIEPLNIADVYGGDVDDSGIDVVIRLRDFPEQPVPNMQQLSASCWVAADHLVYQFAESACFYIHNGRFIDVKPNSGGCFATLKLALQGYMLNVVLTQRNKLVLHGTTMEKDGRALVICGASGSGKSSLSAALLRSGYSLVADDLCHINSHLRVELGFDDLKIWQQTATALAINLPQLKPIRPNVPKYSWKLSRQCHAAPAIAAIVILKHSEQSTLNLYELTGMDKLMPLVGEIYQPWVGKAMQLRQQQIGQLAGYAANLRVYVLERPVGALDITQLQDHADLINRTFELNAD